jgi:uncharacterized circularly permuted ATP-grasp superfamily protein/uncharacterized alpha-E superfamily protein
MSDAQRQESAPPVECLFEHYSGASGVFDEMEQAPRVPRSHWRPLIESLERLGRHEMTSRWENGRRILREHGVTYTVYGDPQGLARPWDLDLVPLLISAEEWARVEAGLVQRSRLLNLILADIYGGSQHLLRDGFLPPELVYANPGFLRPCRGISAPADVYLHLYACDLGRSPDGKWWVLADRTQAPSGTGYAWENRTVISRLLPQEMRECNVQRLGNFFREQREMLIRVAPPGHEHPNVVLLTPGPHNETYFEHAYLARHLGFALVEGADLTVRNRRVFLRTIEGLQRVDVILRRVDDSFCDPLELRGDSFLGVSGLVEAARAGNVTIANPLGAGLLESPAFMAFLPNLCRHLLGEELLLASIATWWCGQAEEMRYVIEHLDRLVIKPAFGGRVAPRPEGRRQSRAPISTERERLVQAIQASPRDFVAQERMHFSRAPVWGDSGLAAGSVVVRTYVANGVNSFAVLPGGLTRVPRNPEEGVVSMQRGGGSKDTWVLSDGVPNRPEPVPAIGETTFIERPLAGVPSRAADHLFWLGRYTERLEQLLRVLRCILGRISGEPGPEGPMDAAVLAELAVKLKLFPDSVAVHSGNGEFAERLLGVLYERDQSGGVRDLLGRVRSIAAAVRDRFSGDMWRVLGRLEADGRSRLGRLPLAAATALIHRLVLDLAAFGGMEMENMTRGYGWRFLDFGRRLERGLCMVNLLSGAASLQNGSSAVLEPVLEIADSAMTYRRQYFAAPRWAGVLELLLRDETNPRSFAFQLAALREHVSAMRADLKSANPQPEQERIRSLFNTLRSANLNELAAHSEQGEPAPLMHLLGGAALGLAALSDEISSHYFSHTVPRFS